MRDELPEVIERLRQLGGAEVNLLHLYPASLTGGWQDGDDRHATVTARRPVLEAALAAVAAAEPGLTVRRGQRVTGLVMAAGPAGPPATGHRYRAGWLRRDAIRWSGGRRWA